MFDVVGAFYKEETASETVSPAVSADERELESLVLTYQLQAEQFKEDFQLERQDHQRTKAQVQSLTTQWSNLHDELRQCQAKVVQSIVLTATAAVPDFSECSGQWVARISARGWSVFALHLQRK